jgi:hypothetical protein
MNEKDAILLLQSEGWTKADAVRGLESIDFAIQQPSESIIRQAACEFAGRELFKRQKLQASQKGIVTKKNSEIDRLDIQNQELNNLISALDADKERLVKINDLLKQDNKYLKNLIDAIRLELTQNIRSILRLEDKDLRKEVAKLFKRSQG